MRNVTKDNITELVTQALSKDIPPRNRQIMTGLIRHMHDFCKEVDLTFDEWLAACEFLRRAGDISDEKRNEFILISDILGVEVLVDMLSHRVTDGESEFNRARTVLPGEPSGPAEGRFDHQEAFR